MADSNTTKFKVLWTDGDARETVAELVLAENLGHYEAAVICERLQRESNQEGDWWRVAPQDAHVWGGMEEFV